METLQSAEQRPICDTSTLGDLLTAVRADAGMTVEDVSNQSAVPVDLLREIESSRCSLSPAELAQALDGYGVPSFSNRLSQYVVVISLEDGWISMKSTRRIWEQQVDADQNLVRYLLLLHEHRDLAAGERIPLRSVDLSLLRAALAHRRPEVEAHLGRLGTHIPLQMRQKKNLLAFAAAGLAVAAGAIVLVPSSSTEAPDAGVVQPPAQTEVVTEVVEVEANGAGAASLPEIGTALVIERSPEEAAQAEQQQAALSGDVDPRIDIGTALVIERSDAELPVTAGPISPRTSRGPPNEEITELKGNN